MARRWSDAPNPVGLPGLGHDVADVEDLSVLTGGQRTGDVRHEQIRNHTREEAAGTEDHDVRVREGLHGGARRAGPVPGGLEVLSGPGVDLHLTGLGILLRV